jgi:hypothetical protein
MPQAQVSAGCQSAASTGEIVRRSCASCQRKQRHGPDDYGAFLETGSDLATCPQIIAWISRTISGSSGISFGAM